MSKRELVDVLNKTTEISKLLTPRAGSFMSGLKTINEKIEFQTWKEELKLQLGELKKDRIIVETLELLDNGFKNGFTDAQDFNNLQGKLKTISLHLDDLLDDETEEKQMVESQKIKKGTKIKTAFDEYILIQQVGSGGNGRVFSAKNKNEEDVAIKFVEKNIDSKKLKRFKNEIYFCEHHNHDNIVRIIDRGYVYLDDKDYVFYVMPLYKETLKTKIKTGIPHEKILDIFIGLLKGLRYAHEHESIHRDIKPENIMFAEGSWEPIICDFGIAHFAEEDLLTIVETKVTDRMANFQYSAPEQRQRGGTICYQTDIYALALILNEMFTKEIPQAAGYKRIKDINEGYAFLDEIFEQIFVQKAEERLYPVDKVLLDMKVYAELYYRRKEAEIIERAINSNILKDEFCAKIMEFESLDDCLTILFDRLLPSEWINILTTGSFEYKLKHIDEEDYEEADDYTPTDIRIESKNKLYMPLTGFETEYTMNKVKINISNWIDKVNIEYLSKVNRRNEQEQKEKEQKRLFEIKRRKTIPISLI